MTNEEAAKVLKLEQDSLRENPKVKVDQRLYDAFDAAIEVLEARWTPISERLPKTFEYVYCTCHSLIDDREDWVVETVYIPQPSDSPYSDWGNIPMLNRCGCVVTAWMHRDIPKPYNAESEIHCNYTDAEIAKSFIDDVEAVKDLLPRAESEVSDANIS